MNAQALRLSWPSAFLTGLELLVCSVEHSDKGLSVSKDLVVQHARRGLCVGSSAKELVAFFGDNRFSQVALLYQW